MSDPMLFPVGDLANNYDDNPMVRRHGRGPAGAHCKTCRFMHGIDYHNRVYWKCYRRGITRGQGTDHRLKWNACRLYEEGL